MHASSRFHYCWSIVFVLCVSLRFVAAASGVVRFVNECDSGSPLLSFARESVGDILETIDEHGIALLSFQETSASEEVCAQVDLDSSAVSIAHGSNTCSMPALSFVLSCSGLVQKSIHCVSGLCQKESIACDDSVTDFELTVTFCPSTNSPSTLPFLHQTRNISRSSRLLSFSSLQKRVSAKDTVLVMVLAVSFGGIALVLIIVLVCFSMNNPSSTRLPPAPIMYTEEKSKLKPLALPGMVHNVDLDLELSKDPITRPSPVRAKRVGRQFMSSLQNNFPNMSMFTIPKSAFED